jgi:hypothetical protein
VNDDVCVRLPREAWILERRGDAAFACEVIQLLWADISHEGAQRARVAEVTADDVEEGVISEEPFRGVHVSNRGVHSPSFSEQSRDE